MVYELNLFLKIKYNPNIPINTHVIHEVIIFIPVLVILLEDFQVWFYYL